MSKEGKIEVKKQEGEQKLEEKESREIAIRKESPFSLFQQMDRMMSDVWRNFDDHFWWPFTTRRLNPIIVSTEPLFRTPLSNIIEEEDHFIVRAEMPGLDKGDIEVVFHDGMLELKGEVKEEKKEEKEGNLVRREYISSKYYRCFNLPEHIDENGIDANLDKGVLTVIIPKVEPTKPEVKKIEIK